VRTDDWSQKQLGQLVQVVLAGVFGIAERMARVGRHPGR